MFSLEAAFAAEVAEVLAALRRIMFDGGEVDRGDHDGLNVVFRQMRGLEAFRGVEENRRRLELARVAAALAEGGAINQYFVELFAYSVGLRPDAPNPGDA